MDDTPGQHFSKAERELMSLMSYDRRRENTGWHTNIFGHELSHDQQIGQLGKVIEACEDLALAAIRLRAAMRQDKQLIEDICTMINRHGRGRIDVRA